MYYMVIFWQVGEVAEVINAITYRMVIICQVEAAEAIDSITYGWFYFPGAGS